MKYQHTVDEGWRAIRAMRHQPPGNASLKPRRLLFAAAMKQSEQFFRLSDQAGYETKPILLYYGLNQAARAIVAALAFQRDPWELNGHGLTCPNLNSTSVLGDVTIVDQGAGKAFQMLAKYTYSATLPNKVTFRELWACLPEGLEVPLHGSSEVWSAAKLAIVNFEDGGKKLDRTLDGRFAARLEGRLPLDGMTADDAWAAVLERYPELASFRSFKRRDEDTIYFDRVGGRGDESLPLTVRQPDVSGDVVAQLSAIRNSLTGHQLLECGLPIFRDEDRGCTWLMPTLPPNTEPLSPITGWWAVLYVLSMLARYQPSSWTKMLDIDSSPDAPAVEYLLDEAHRVCVNLILHALEDSFLQVLHDLADQASSS